MIVMGEAKWSRETDGLGLVSAPAFTSFVGLGAPDFSFLLCNMGTIVVVRIQ